MNKIISNSVEYVFLYEIEGISGGEILLRPDRSWRKLAVSEKPVYRSEVRQSDAGPLNEETVTAKVRHDPLHPLRKFAAYPLLLRMHTDSETFPVGSPQYPAAVEAGGDRIYDTFSFRAVSEA